MEQTKFKLWSSEEISFLEQGCHDGKSDNQIAEELGRTLISVQAARKRLRILRVSYQPSNWTDAEVAQLRKLAVETFTAQQIADTLGKKLTTINGKLSRLGITRPHMRMPPSVRKNKEKEKQDIVEGKQPPRQIFFKEPIPAGAVPLLKLTPHGCRYVYGDKSNFMFCPNNAKHKSSYCKHHHPIVWKKTEKRV